MPAPYSNDLRQRVIEAYQNQEGSQRQLAQRFKVSESFIKRLIRRYRETGQVSPLAHGGGARAKIEAKDLAVVQQLVKQQPDALLRELCERWTNQTGIEVSIATMHRAVEKFSCRNYGSGLLSSWIIFAFTKPERALN